MTKRRALALACTMAAKAVRGRENPGNFPFPIPIARFSGRELGSHCLLLPKKSWGLIPLAAPRHMRPEDGVGGYCLLREEPGLGKLGLDVGTPGFSCSQRCFLWQDSRQLHQ